MAGSLQRILPLRVFDFASLPVGSTQTLAIAQRIDISQYIDAMLAVRVHSPSNISVGTLSFDLFGDGFTTDDPGLIFRTTAPLFSSTSLPAVSGSTFTQYGGTVRGTYADLILSVTRSNVGTLRLVASVDLILRTPDSS